MHKDKPHKHSQICEVVICTTPTGANGNYCSYFHTFLAQTEQLKANGHQKIEKIFLTKIFSSNWEILWEVFSHKISHTDLTRLTRLTFLTWISYGSHIFLTYFSHMKCKKFSTYFPNEMRLKTIYKILKYHIHGPVFVGFLAEIPQICRI